MLTIAEAAAETGLTTHTLRYYERDGLIAVPRSSTGHRRYSDKDLDWIRLISKLRTTGMPIREIRRYAQLVRAGQGNEAERLDLLTNHRERVRSQLAQVAAHLEAVEIKIAYYRDAAGTCERPDEVNRSSQASSAVPG